METQTLSLSTTKQKYQNDIEILKFSTKKSIFIQM